MRYGYERVSSRGQARDGNSLEAQANQLREAGAEIIFSDEYTGTKNDRPQFQKMLTEIKTGDTLIVTKLDRFARSVKQGIEIIDSLISKDITVHVLNIGVIDNTPTGKLIRNIMLAFAEFERDMIVQRTQEGKAIAKTKKEYREGRPPKYSKAQIGHAIVLLESNSYKQVEEMTGISKSTLLRWKSKRMTDSPDLNGGEDK